MEAARALTFASNIVALTALEALLVQAEMRRDRSWNEALRRHDALAAQLTAAGGSFDHPPRRAAAESAAASAPGLDGAAP